MRYEAIRDKEFKDTWRVEAVDRENELLIYVALFTGPDAGDRATAYVDWQNFITGAPME